MQLCATILSVFLFSATLSQSQGLAIPAAGLIDLDEFTIEMWVMLAFDPQQEHDGQISRGFIYELNYGDPAYPGDCLHWYMFTERQARDKKMATLTYNQVYAMGDRLMYSLLGSFQKNVTTNSWHHLAASFRGRMRCLYYDGEGTPDQLSGHFAHVLRDKAVLQIGSDVRHTPTYLAFDEIRISSIARSREQLGFFAKEPLKPDPHTTLLLTFDGSEVSADGTTIKPIFAATPQAAGLPKPQVGRWIDGKFGKALLLAPPAKQ